MPKAHPTLPVATQTLLRALGATVRHAQGPRWTATWPTAPTAPTMTRQSVTVTYNGTPLSPPLTLALPNNTPPWVPLPTLAHWIQAHTPATLRWTGSRLILSGAPTPPTSTNAWIGGGTSTFLSDGVSLDQAFGVLSQAGTLWIPLPVAESVIAASGMTALPWNGTSRWAWTGASSQPSHSSGTLTPPSPPPTP